MNKRGEQLTKRVEFATKDDAEQVATGIVMVPNAVDLQGDWERPETIQEFAEQFGNFEEVGEAGGGVMHAVFPDDHVSLERNEVVDEATTINGADVPEGAWVQSWHFADEELWELVSDGILSGYSIGAVDVRWDGPMEQDDLPEEVSVPEEIGEDEPVWELVSGIIREVSSVDIPAVPDALILETKDAAEKRLADHLGNRDGFIEEALQRGHSETEAERLWEYLNRAVDVEGAGQPGKESLFERIGKAAVNAFTGGGRAAAEKDAGEFKADVFRVVAPEDDADQYDDDVLGVGVDFPNSDVYVDWRNEVFPDPLDDPHVSVYGSIGDLEQATGNSTEQLDTLDAKAAKALFDSAPTSVKEGRTLSRQNRESLYATIDASLDVLQDAGVDHGMTRFTDSDDTTFDLSEHSAREWATDDDDPDDGDEDEEPDEDAPDGETSDATTDMSDDTTEGEGDEKSLAEQNAEQINELTSAVEDLTEAVTDDGEEKTAQIEVDGEVYEVSESEVKTWFEDNGDADDPMAEAPPHVKALSEKVDAVNERIDTISQQSGVSTQLERAGGEEEEEEDGGLGGLGKALS